MSANHFDWSRLLIQIHILNDKQCRSRSVGFFRSQLIWCLRRQGIYGFSSTRINIIYVTAVLPGRNLIKRDFINNVETTRITLFSKYHHSSGGILCYTIWVSIHPLVLHFCSLTWAVLLLFFFMNFLETLHRHWYWGGVVWYCNKGNFHYLSTELWPMVDIKILFPLKVLRTKEWIYIKFYMHIDID